MNAVPHIVPMPIGIQLISDRGVAGNNQLVEKKMRFELEVPPEDILDLFQASHVNSLFFPPADEPPTIWQSPTPQDENLQLLETFIIVGTQPEPTPMPHSFNKLTVEEIASLPIKDFAKAARRTKDPRKMLLGLSAIEQAEEALQQGIRQYLKDEYGVEPTGKVRLNIIIQKYESVKKGTTYKGYVQAAHGNQSTIFYRLTEEELAEELSRRQIIQPADLCLT